MRETSDLLVAILCMKVEWRSVTTTYGALCAMTFLEDLIVLLSVDNLDLVMLVYTSIPCIILWSCDQCYDAHST